MSDLKDDTNPDKLIDATENLEISEGGKKKKNNQNKGKAEGSLILKLEDPEITQVRSGDNPDITQVRSGDNSGKIGR